MSINSWKCEFCKIAIFWNDICSEKNVIKDSYNFEVIPIFLTKQSLWCLHEMKNRIAKAEVPVEASTSYSHGMTAEHLWIPEGK